MLHPEQGYISLIRWWAWIKTDVFCAPCHQMITWLRLGFVTLRANLVIEIPRCKRDFSFTWFREEFSRRKRREKMTHKKISRTSWQEVLPRGTRSRWRDPRGSHLGAYISLSSRRDTKQKFRNLTKPRANSGVCVVQLQLQRIYHPRVAPRATAALQRPSHEDNLYFLHPVPNS